jgi:hypothetical protein
MRLDLTRDDLDRILAALDSHVYWQLSDQHYRNDASVLNPGSDDPEQQGHGSQLAKMLRRHGATPPVTDFILWLRERQGAPSPISDTGIRRS